MSGTLVGTMKKAAKPHPESRLHVVCPFCDAPVDKFTDLRWCTSCNTEWYRGRNGIMFDDRRHTDRFAFAKAVVGAGGFRMG